MRAVHVLILLLLPTPFTAMAYEQAFPPTASGVNELKTLPAGVLLRASGQGDYFDRAQQDAGGKGLQVIHAAGGRGKRLFIRHRGARGSYSRANFERTRGELLSWLAARSDLEAAGEAVAIFWSGPFTPWFVKRYEVHVPVRPRAP